MTDGITTTVGILATDDIGGIHYPYSKQAFGADNTATPVSADTPLPTADAALASATRWVTITASDTAVLNPLPKALYALSDGNLALRGSDAAVVIFPVKAGQLLPLRPARVMATNTTATVAGLF